ncbi:MAG TPA: ATP-binding cassette domain-containing protein [Patescibacteria group bacterium]|jgi:ATP-binding cassette subfamily F protein 3|nr:ATP-binding cassette domain-containing protein [Patescibacteria group bacterium]
MANDNVILRFSDVTFSHDHHKQILNEAAFSVRTGSRITLMGQNGAGKSTLFKLITGEYKPNEGDVYVTPNDATIAIAKQVMPQEALAHTVRDYFETAFKEKTYNLDKLIKEVFEVVNMELPLDKLVNELSGGQQARLLLAHALIQNPDILLLDEPTNNLDTAGVEHLTGFLMMYEKTVIVISHDADFLNAFSDGVLYLDVHTKKVEQYNGNYYDVVEEIKNRIERENLQNARMQTQIKEKRSQAEVFAHKGGKLRAVAKRMRETAEEAEENLVNVRQEDKTIRNFEIPMQEFDTFFDGKILQLSKISALKNGKVEEGELEMIVRKNTHVIISGPNGIGKSTFLEKLTSVEPGQSDLAKDGFFIAPNVTVGYYKQDFSNFDFEQKAFDVLQSAMKLFDEHTLRSTAAGFLLDGKLLDKPIKALSEGQKGLLSFCRLMLLQPGLLILDEPTNHINFRHLPVIAKALDNYEGAMVMVSHVPDFVQQIRIDEVIDLNSVGKK